MTASSSASAVDDERRVMKTRRAMNSASCSAVRATGVVRPERSSRAGDRRVRANGFTIGCLALFIAACRHVDPLPLAPEASAAAIQSRTLADPELHAFIGAVTSETPPAWPPAAWDLRLLTIAAIYFHPALAVARADAALAAAAIQTAGARPNPTLALAPEWSANPPAGVSPWLAAVHLDWPIETAGKRSHRIARATAAAEVAALGVASQVAALRTALAAAVVDLEAARVRANSLRAERAAAAHWVELVDDRVARGAAAAAELAPIRLASLAVEAETSAAEADERLARVRLAEALAVPAAACRDVVLAELPPADADPLARLSRAEALRIALFGRSDIAAALADYASAEAALRLEVARQYPDLHLGTGYTFDQGESKWGIGVSLDLPILDRNEGPIAEAEAARAASGARFAALQTAVVAQVELALARRDGARDRAVRLGEVASERATDLVRARDRVGLGAADRAEEVAASVEAIRAERAAFDAQTALRQALAELGGVIQEPSPELDRALAGRS
jgi:outer membrane protein TolC